MSKKDFIALADMIRSGFSQDPFTARQIQALAAWCSAMNPRFNRELWMDYIAGKCGPSGGKVK